MNAIPEPPPVRGGERRRGASVLRQILIHLAVFAIVIIGWEMLGWAGQLNELILPAPSAIGAAIYDLYIAERTIYWHFFVTLFEGFTGFLIGSAIGIALAVGAALSPVFGRYIAPYAVVLNVTPGLALTPIFIAWFGFGWSSKIAISALISFFPVFVNTLSGLLRVDQDAREMFRSLGASKWQTFWKLMMPDAMPIIVAGLKVALTTGLIGAIVGEFVSATEGIGILMQRFSFSLDIDFSIATLLSMSMMGLLLFTAMEIFDNRVVFWRHDSRMAAVSRKRARRWRM